MKSKFLSIAALGVLVSLGACSQCPSKDGQCTKSGGDVVYTGVLPGADVYGIRYTVLLDYDDDEPGGDYEMVQSYVNLDSTGTIVDVASFYSEGDFTTGTRDGKKYIQLSGKGAEQTYFLVTGDDTIEMTNAELTQNTTPLNSTRTTAKHQ